MARRLELLPDSDGYAVEPSAAGTIENKLPGGFAARRRDLENITKIFTVQWTCDPYKFRYLWNFYREWLESMDWFDILLVDEINHAEYPLQNYKAMFMPDSVKTVSVNGWTRVFSCQLEAHLDNPYPMSTVYPIAAYEDIKLLNWKCVKGNMFGFPSDSSSIANYSLTAATLRQQTFHSSSSIDSASVSNYAIEDGSVKQWVFHSTVANDSSSISNYALVNGYIKDQLIAYKNYAPEGCGISGFQLLEGELK